MPANRQPDFTPAEPGRERARMVAAALRADTLHPTVVAAKRTNAGLAAMRTLRRDRRRHERPDPPSAWACVMEGLRADDDWPEP